MGRSNITTLNLTGPKQRPARKKSSTLSNFVTVATVGGILASLGVVGSALLIVFSFAFGALANGILLYVLNFALTKVLAVTMFPFVKDLYAGLSLTIVFRLVSALRGPSK